MIYIIVFLLILLTIIMRIISGSWLVPANFNNMIWVFMLITSVFFQQFWGKLSLLTAIVIFLYCLAVSAGGLVFYKRNIYPDSNNQYYLFKNENLRIIYLISILLSLITLPIIFTSYNLPYLYCFNLTKLASFGRHIASLRYSGEPYISTTLKLFIVFEYFSLIIIGVFFAFNKYTDKKIKQLEKFLAIIPIYVAIVLSLVCNIKLFILNIIYFICSGFFATAVYLKKGNVKLLKEYGIKLLFFSIVAIILSIGLMVVRYSTTDISVVLSKFLVYAIGHIFALDHWLNNNLTNHLLPYGFGIYTFEAFFSWLGLKQRALGAYDFIFFENGYSSNVFTFLRGYIIDFGLIGGILLTFILSLLFHKVYRALQQGRFIYIPILIVFYHGTLTGQIISNFRYTSYILAYLMVFLSFRFFIYRRNTV